MHIICEEVPTWSKLLVRFDGYAMVLQLDTEMSFMAISYYLSLPFQPVVDFLWQNAIAPGVIPSVGRSVP